MNKTIVSIPSIAALLTVAIIAVSGCGGPECAEGTIEEDGSCVMAAEPTECDDGQFAVDGECMDASSVCGEHTTYDEGQGICVADVEQIDCGTNTELVDGECVAQEPAECGSHQELGADDNICYVTEDACDQHTAFSGEEDRCVPVSSVCDDGTEFSEETGLCLPEARCKAGDVILDGYCVAPADELAADAEFVADGNTDPNFDGTPVDVDVKSIGESSIFSGTIDGPSDLDEDGTLDQHVDYFRFDADAGDWFEISVRSTGIPNPAFAVFSEDAEEHELERFSSVGTTRDKMRQIVVPEDGTYFIAVQPETTLIGTLLDDHRALGADDWSYVGTLEAIETPDADDPDMESENLQGTLGRLDDNFYFADQFDAGHRVDLTWTDRPLDAEPVFQFWASPTEFIGEDSGSTVSVEVPESGEFYFVVDWRVLFGSVLDYELQVEAFATLEAGDEITETVSADSADVIEVRQMNDDLASVEVTITESSSGQDIVGPVSLGTLPNQAVRYVGLDEGDYDVTIANPTGNDIEGFTSDIDVVSPSEITDLGETQSGTATDSTRGHQDYYLVELSEAAHHRLTLSHQDGDGFGKLFVYQLGDELVAETAEEASEQDPVQSVVAEFDADTPYVIRVGNDGFLDNDFDYELDFQEVVLLEAGDQLEGEFSAEKGDVLEVMQSNDDDADVQLTVTDSGTDTIIDTTLGTSDSVQYVGLEGEDYTATFENTTGDDIEGFSFDVSVITPIEAADFDPDERDPLRITQTNNDDVAVVLVVTDDDGETSAYEEVGPEDELLYTARSDGEHTVSYFRFGVDTADQEVDGMDVDVEFGEIEDVADVDVAIGDVLEITQTNADDDDVDVVVTHESSGETVISATVGAGDADIFRYVGLEQDGNHIVSVVSFDEDFDPSDFSVDAGFTTPELVDDFEATYEGTANESITGEQSYYLIEVEATTTYEMQASLSSAEQAWGRMYLYEIGDELVDRNENASGSFQSLTYEFDMDATYVLRLGDESSSLSGDFDYELEFIEQ